MFLCDAQAPTAACPVNPIGLSTRGGVVMSDPGAQAAVHDVDLSGFKAVEFPYERVHTTGGKLRTPMPMVTRRVKAGGKDKTFVKMSMSDPWLLFATTGQRHANASTYGNRSLLDVLREHAEQAYNGGLFCAADPVADDAGDDDYDPMNEVDSEETSAAKYGQTRGRGDNKRARYHKNHAKHKLLDIDFPRHPPELVKDGKDKRSVRIYIIDRKQVWLQIDDVPWAMKYLYVQNMLKGVPLVAPDSEGPSAAASSSSVAPR